MNFTYQVIKYNKESSQLFVLYTPDNEQSKYKWIGIDPSWSEQQITNEIVLRFPFELWNANENTSVQQLIGIEKTAVFETSQQQEQIVTEEELADQAKKLRKSLLFESDWTQLPNVPLTQEQKTNWEVYRQQLRDITMQQGFPVNIEWPNEPTN